MYHGYRNQDVTLEKSGINRTQIFTTLFLNYANFCRGPEYLLGGILFVDKSLAMAS